MHNRNECHIRKQMKTVSSVVFHSNETFCWKIDCLGEYNDSSLNCSMGWSKQLASLYQKIKIRAKSPSATKYYFL